MAIGDEDVQQSVIVIVEETDPPRQERDGRKPQTRQVAVRDLIEPAGKGERWQSVLTGSGNLRQFSYVSEVFRAVTLVAIQVSKGGVVG